MMGHQLEYLQVYVGDGVKNRTQATDIVLLEWLWERAIFGLINNVADKWGYVYRVGFGRMVHKGLAVHVNFSQERSKTLKITTSIAQRQEDKKHFRAGNHWIH